jgi:hypothetical protein
MRRAPPVTRAAPRSAICARRGQAQSNRPNSRRFRIAITAMKTAMTAMAIMRGSEGSLSGLYRGAAAAASALVEPVQPRSR